MPSMNQIKYAIIDVHLLLLQEQSTNTWYDPQMERAQELFEDAFSYMFDLADLGDLDAQISVKVLREDPKHPVVQTILYLYSLDPSFYRFVNWATREQIHNYINEVGAFSYALSEIFVHNESRRPDKKTSNFTVYRGVSVPVNEIKSYQYICE